MAERRIGAVAVGVVEQDGHVLLEPMARWLNTGLVWRPIGGYIEFGEYAADAVVREFREELGRDVEVRGLIGVYENLVTFEPDAGPLEIHEVAFLYELRFADHHRPEGPRADRVVPNRTRRRGRNIRRRTGCRSRSCAPGSTRCSRPTSWRC